METQIKPNTVDMTDVTQIEAAVGFFIDNGAYDDAAVLYQRLVGFFSQDNFKRQTEVIMNRYANAFAKLCWFILNRIDIQYIPELFASHIEYFFDYPWDFIETELRGVLAALPDYAQRDEVKHGIHVGIKESFVQLGKKNILVNGVRSLPSIQNWIRDFEYQVGEDNAVDALQVAEYLNTSLNVALLTSEERVKLEGLLRFYFVISSSSFTPEGNEDVIIFHDVESGHIKYIERGKEIDTGIESTLVAQMTPAERVAARSKINNHLNELDQVLENQVGLPLTPILQQQLLRNNALRQAIFATDIPDEKQIPATEGSFAPARVTFPEQSVKQPIQVKKVEPIQTMMPTPPQPVAVSVAPKPRIVPTAAPTPVPAPMPVMPTVAPNPNPAPAPVPQVPVAPKPMPQAPVIPKPNPVIAPPQAPTPKKETEGIDYASLAELVLAEHALLLASVEAENRFLSLIAAFAKGERTRDEVITTLTMPIESGGVNITADIAASCLNTAERFTHGAQLGNRRQPQAAAAEKKAQPTFQQVTDMMQRHKAFEDTRAADKQSLVDAQQPTPANFLSVAPAPAPVSTAPRTGVEDIFANLDVAQMQQKSVAPETNSPIRRIDSIRTQQSRPNGKQQFEQVMGPMQELQKFAIADLRAFGKNPETATAFIKEKIDLQTQESISKRAEAIRAWQESPLHQLYVQIGNASLSQGMPVNQYIQQREQTGQETLTAAEFEAIASLNRQLRF